MPDLIMLVDSAVTVPVNLLPLLDDGDFKTIETSVAYNAAGLALVWNFQTAAGVQTQTAVTPTNTGGVYDWTAIGNGMYKIEIPASGGGTINNDTEGFGWFTGVATGVLPWRSPLIQFSPANVVNSDVTGSDLRDVSVAQWSGTNVASPHTAGYPVVTIKDGVGTGEIDTLSGKVLLQDDAIGASTIITVGGNALTFVSAADVADAIADEDLSTHTDPGSLSEVIQAIQTAIAALNNLSEAQVNAQMLDVLVTDTFAEPSSVPAATTTLAVMIHWLYTLARNKKTQTATTQSLRNDADSGNISTSSVSDNGTTLSQGEWS